MTDADTGFEPDQDRYQATIDRGQASITSSSSPGITHLSREDCDDFTIEIELLAIPQLRIPLAIRANASTDDGDSQIGIAPKLTATEAEQLGELLLLKARTARAMEAKQNPTRK